jgi:hypothetical protein
MGFHDMLDDGEAQPGPAEFARAGFIDPVESLEDTRPVRFRDADS